MELSTFASHIGPLLCVFMASFLQSATGFGLVMVAAPLLMYFYDAKLVILIVALFAVCGNATQSFFLRRDARYDVVGWLLLGSVFGQQIGFHIYRAVSPVWLKLVISVVILLSLTLMQTLHLRVALRPRNTVSTGFIAGIMATTVGMNGPPLILYFSHAPFTPAQLRATSITFFFTSNIVALTTFFLGGVDFTVALREFVYVLPGLAVGILAGHLVFDYIPAQFFRRILFVILVVMCLHTIWGAVAAM